MIDCLGLMFDFSKPATEDMHLYAPKMFDIYRNNLARNSNTKLSLRYLMRIDFFRNILQMYEV